MKVTNQIKEQISAALKADFDAKSSTFKSRNTYAKSIDIHPSTVSNVISYKWRDNQVLVSDNKWSEIAAAINFIFTTKPNDEWRTAETEVYNHLTTILTFCKENSETAIFIDIAGIGKSYTSKEFQKNNSHVFIIKGSKATTSSRFIKELTKVVGLEQKGRYADMMDNAIARLLSYTSEKPLLIYDEAGDFDDKTFLLIKQLYNELEDKCGMFMTGAGGLKKKLDSGIRLDKNGFDEVSDRFGYKEAELSIVPDDTRKREKFMTELRTEICKANGIGSVEELEKIMERGGSGRRAKKEINKRNAA